MFIIEDNFLRKKRTKKKKKLSLNFTVQFLCIFYKNSDNKTDVCLFVWYVRTELVWWTNETKNKKKHRVWMKKERQRARELDKLNVCLNVYLSVNQYNILGRCFPIIYYKQDIVRIIIHNS